ncbi:MAG: diaminopimelate epimerase [Pseudomonadota bacterium]
MSLSGHPYLKMNGIGNSFVVLDVRQSRAAIDPGAASLIADPVAGIGCDQLITIDDRDGSIFMGVWNADGSQVETCGNALRCVAWHLMQEAQAETIPLQTLAGEHHAQRLGDKRVAVTMGTPKFGWKQIPLAEQMDDTRFVDIKLGPIDNPVLWGPSAVNVGNPHCVFFVDDIDAHALDRFGPLIENHPLFPERANVSIAKVESSHQIRLRVWERGVGITKACGSAACAAAVAAHRRRLTDRKVTVQLDGGNLGIEWRANDVIVMAGPVELEHEGVLPDIF